VLNDLLAGLFRVVAWLWSRPTLRARISEDNPNEEVGGLKFEIENVSDNATSLDPSINVTFVTVKRHRGSAVFDVRDLDRNLPPFTPKLFSASAREVQPQRGHAWFRVYMFLPRKGRACRVRIRNASLEQIGFFRFWVERVWFQMTGRVGGKTSMTIDEYHAQQRAKGPH